MCAAWRTLPSTPSTPANRSLDKDRAMKVVLFCGGQGLRMREYSESIPKPMVTIGYRPILWHVMRYYAHYGHREFVLCLGHRSDVIKQYFLDYNEATSNDFVLHGGDRTVELLGKDIEDWRISFIDTGLRSNVGERLAAVREHVEDDEIFLANYGDIVTDAPINDFIEEFRASGKVAGFISVRPTTYTFHLVELAKGDRLVRRIDNISSSSMWINGGYLMFRPSIFDYIGPGDDLIPETFHRLVEAEQLVAFRYEGFWAPLDSIRDVQILADLHESGRAPWMVWEHDGAETGS
jgi:glucose-1-phosphate cytidylyltransferase